eukprot:2759168-Lingulodinium_polyedra.AAC.1
MHTPLVRRASNALVLARCASRARVCACAINTRPKTLAIAEHAALACKDIRCCIVLAHAHETEAETWKMSDMLHGRARTLA